LSATTAHYHVAIVGTDLAGLILGAMCAKQGFRVVVIGQGGKPSLYRHENNTFARRLELCYGLSSPPVRAVFERLGLGLELRNMPRPVEPAYQVVLPGARVDASGDRQLLRAELDREFPGERAAIEACWERIAAIDEQVREVLALGVRLPPRGLIEGLRFRRLVKSFPFLDDEWAIEDPLVAFPHGHPLRAFFLAPFRFACRMLPARPYPATLVRCLHELHGGVYSFGSGPDALRELFSGIIRSAGDFRPDARVTHVEIRRGKATSLTLRDRRQAVGCDVLVCNTEPKRFFSLIPLETQREDFHHAIQTLQPVYHTFTGSFAVGAQAIPEEMARDVFAVYDLHAPLEEDNLLHIQLDPAAPRATAAGPADVRVVSASMRVPIGACSGGASAARDLLDTLQARVEQVVPFLSEHLVARHTPWLRDDGVQEVDPLELNPCYGEAIEHTLGTSPVATGTGYKNVLLGSDAAFCGLGHDAAFVSALHLMAQVSDLIRVKSGF